MKLHLDGAAMWTAPVGTRPPVGDPPREGWSRMSGIDPAEILRVASIRVAFEQDVAAVRRATSCTPAEAADLRATALALVPDLRLTPWQLIALDRALDIATTQPHVRRGLAVAVRAAYDMRSTTPARIGNHMGLPRPRETYRGGVPVAIDSSTMQVNIDANIEAAVRAFAEFARELDRWVTAVGGLDRLEKLVRRHQLARRRIARAMGHRARRADRRRRHAAARAARTAARP